MKSYHANPGARAIAVNRLKPIIDRLFPFEQAVEVFRYYEKIQPFGKVVISHSQLKSKIF